MSDTTYPMWVQDLVQEWRERLIPDWRIVLMPEPLDEDGEGLAGQSQANVTYRRLSLWIDMEQGNYLSSSETSWKRDVEEVIVHELLHAPVELILDAYRPAKEHMGHDARQLIARTAELAEEHLIESVSRLLVALKYGEMTASQLRLAAKVA